MDPFRPNLGGHTPDTTMVVHGILASDPLRREVLRQCWLQYPEEVASVGLDIAEMLESYAGTGHERHLLRSLEGVSAMRATLERVWRVTGRDRT